MTPEQKALVRQTWRQVAPIADTAAALFYGRLFEIDQDLRGLFAGVDLTLQGKKLTGAIGATVDALDRFDEMVPEIEALGRRHAGYGVREAHYDTVGAALLWTLETGLGDAWSEDVAAAWAAAYGAIASVMRNASAPDGDTGPRRLATHAT